MHNYTTVFFLVSIIVIVVTFHIRSVNPLLGMSVLDAVVHWSSHGCVSSLNFIFFLLMHSHGYTIICYLEVSESLINLLTKILCDDTHTV